jgi:hypothetical protein
MFLTAFLRWRRRRTPEEQVFYAREHSRATLGWVGLGIHQGVHVFLVLLVGFQGGMVQSFDFGFVFCLLR